MSEPQIKYDNFGPEPDDAFIRLFQKEVPGFKLEQALALKQLSKIFQPYLEHAIKPDIVRALAQKPKIVPDYPLWCAIHERTDTEEQIVVSVFALKADRETAFPHKKKETEAKEHAHMTLRVVRVDPGKEPLDTSIPNNLQGMQGVVGGYLEPVHRVPLQVGRELVYYANEDGLRLGLQPNRRVGGSDIVGPFLVVAVSGNQEDSLTADEVAMVVSQLGPTTVRH